MKVFVDTNVWLSGRFHTGLCARLLDGLVETGNELLLDKRVLEEFARIAQHKFQVEDELLRRTLMFFHEYARVVPASSEPVPGVNDPDDALILAAALAADAQWFVTGDGALLECRVPGQIVMLAPREAYERLIALR